MRRLAHEAPPPPHWPDDIQYLSRSRLSPAFPPQLITALPDRPLQTHPDAVVIRLIDNEKHPAYRGRGLFAKRRISSGERIIGYIGIIHADLMDEVGVKKASKHDSSDYDLSLLRISISDPRNPFPGQHISIGIDAAVAGNAARFINDYRGIAVASNAEFRSGDHGMEVWSLRIIGKGEEIVVSYGKAWWGARS